MCVPVCVCPPLAGRGETRRPGPAGLPRGPRTLPYHVATPAGICGTLRTSPYDTSRTGRRGVCGAVQCGDDSSAARGRVKRRGTTYRASPGVPETPRRPTGGETPGARADVHFTFFFKHTLCASEGGVAAGRCAVCPRRGHHLPAHRAYGGLPVARGDPEREGEARGWTLPRNMVACGTYGEFEPRGGLLR